MPLWTIYHPPTVFTDTATKQALAHAITQIYTAIAIPAFYVNVLFQPIEATSFFVGGVSRPSSAQAQASSHEPGAGPDSTRPFIRITIQNIARKITNNVVRDGFLGRVDAALRPFIADKGFDWEYSVLETSRDLWKIQGLVPPFPDSVAEREWTRANRATEFEAEDDGRGGGP
ncbi:hypothetical protein ACEQ8H_007070 [Pleosporales sp. CAS-2024a]